MLSLPGMQKLIPPPMELVHNVLYTKSPRADVSRTATRPLPPEVGPESTWLIRPGRAASKVFDKGNLRAGLAYRCTGCAPLCNELTGCSTCMYVLTDSPAGKAPGWIQITQARI